MKTALVCDWLTGMRGGERCLEAACELYPAADIFTLVHIRGGVSKAIESHKITTSYIQNLPGKIEKFRRYLPLFPHAIRRFDLSGYNCVLSFSHCVAKGIKIPLNVPHICYCFTPMRYAWHMRSEYISNFGYPKKWGAEILLNYLKNWDRRVSFGVTHFISISETVRNRITQAYNRDSVVIYPPVECSRFAISDEDDGYYLIVSALVPYKRIDLAVAAFGGTGQKLVIVGNGPELPRLKSMASANVCFVDSASDRDIVEYMRKCRALIFPGEEDFGIVPLEAQACGKPVIAFGKGGALETVVPDETGIFFHKQTSKALLEAVLSFEKTRGKFAPRKSRDNALRFDRSIYQQSIQHYIQSAIG